VPNDTFTIIKLLCQMKSSSNDTFDHMLSTMFALVSKWGILLRISCCNGIKWVSSPLNKWLVHQRIISMIFVGNAYAYISFTTVIWRTQEVIFQTLLSSMNTMCGVKQNIFKIGILSIKNVQHNIFKFSRLRLSLLDE